MRFRSYLSSKNERRSCRNSDSRSKCSKLPRKFELSLQISKLRGHAWHRLTVKYLDESAIGCVCLGYLECPFWYLNVSLPIPFLYFNSWSPYPFINLQRGATSLKGSMVIFGAVQQVLLLGRPLILEFCGISCTYAFTVYQLNH